MKWLSLLVGCAQDLKREAPSQCNKYKITIPLVSPGGGSRVALVSVEYYSCGWNWELWLEFYEGLCHSWARRGDTRRRQKVLLRLALTIFGAQIMV